MKRIAFMNKDEIENLGPISPVESYVKRIVLRHSTFRKKLAGDTEEMDDEKRTPSFKRTTKKSES